MSDIEYHDELFPGIWDGKKIKFLVKDHLLKIAKAFMKHLDMDDFTYHDIILTGSIANYNWTEQSDIDIHIMVDFDDFDDSPEVLRVLFDSKKSLWSKEHNITIKGHPVEIYVENIGSIPVSDSGRFSIHFNKWIKKPKHYKFDTHDPTVLKKVIDKLGQLNAILSDNRVHDLEKFLNDIYEMRQKGLHKNGEFSPENLAFKILRNRGVIQKVKDLMNSVEDDELTLESDFA